MAGIYNRDNFAQGMQNALNNAYNRRAATQRERAERAKEIVNAGGDFAKVLGRTVEEWNVPDQYKDNPDYRAARFDYILGGDRSGLDAFRQAEMQAEQARKQQEFTAAENALNRKLQASEGDKNRKLQKQQQALEKMTEKARMWRDINDADALVSDIKNNPEKYGGKDAAAFDLAKARHGRDLALSMAAESGLFTGTELKPFQSVNLSDNSNTPSGNTDTPAGNTDTPPAAPAAPAVDWTAGSPEVSRLYDEAKTLKDIAAADEKFKALGVPKTKTDAYQALVAKKNAATKRVNDAVAAKAKKQAMMDQAKTYKFSKTDLREKLQIGKEGGGLKEAELDWPFKYNGKTFPAKAKAINKGDFVDIVVDGEVTQQDVPLY